MAYLLRSCLIFLVVFAFLTGSIKASNSRPPRNNEISNMADALKYLQDLDTYYGDRARVRFGKRTLWNQLLRSRLANNPEVIHPIELPQADEPF